MTWKDNAIGYFMCGSMLGLTVYETYRGWQSANALVAQSGITELLDKIQTYAHEMAVNGAGGLVMGFLGSAAIVAAMDLAARRPMRRKFKSQEPRQSPSLLEQTSDEVDKT